MDIGKRYTFDTLAPSVLGGTIKQALFKGTVDYATACLHMPMLHTFRLVFPSLPANTSSDPKDTVYHIFETQLGGTLILADIWINQSSITLVETVNIRVNVADANITDSDSIRNALTALGIKNFTIEIV